MLKNRFILISLFIFVLSCKTSPELYVHGTYEYKSDIAFGKLILFEDGTFNHSYDIPLASYESKGRWRKQNKSIILTSEESYKNDYMIVSEKTGQNESYIQILDEYNNPVDSIFISINGKQKYYTTDSNGKINLSSQNEKEIKSITVDWLFLSTKHNVYYVKSKESNQFIIKIIPKNFMKKYYDDSRFKVRKNKIIMNKQVYTKIKHTS